MGYTHYFKKTDNLTSDQVQIIKKEARRLLRTEEAKAETAYECDHPSLPARVQVMDGGIIRFNGRDDDGHETFHIDLVDSDNDMFAFCKTARKPYDKYVCAILISLAFHAPKCFSLGSDGELSEPEWMDAAEYYAKVIGVDVETVLEVIENEIV